MEQRQIKFRAWDKKSKQMLQPANIHWHIDGDVVMSGTWGKFDTSEDEEIEIMQFTGLLDKNSKEIYEGDIIQTNNNSESSLDYYLAVCVWKKENAAFVFEVPKEIRPYWMENWSSLILSMKIPDIEIVGNLYQNPELLTKE